MSMTFAQRKWFEEHGIQGLEIDDMEVVSLDLGGTPSTVTPDTIIMGVMPLWMVEALEAADHMEPFNPKLVEQMCDAYNRERNL